MTITPADLYAAYNAGGDPATANLNFRGEPCPTWEALPPNVRAKWEATLDAVVGRDLRTNLDFGSAIVALKQGAWIRRNAWSNPASYLFLIDSGKSDGSTFFVPSPPTDFPKRTVSIGLAHPATFPWVPTARDLLATDWVIVEEGE